MLVRVVTAAALGAAALLSLVPTAATAQRPASTAEIRAPLRPPERWSMEANVGDGIRGVASATPAPDVPGRAIDGPCRAADADGGAVVMGAIFGGVIGFAVMGVATQPYYSELDLALTAAASIAGSAYGANYGSRGRGDPLVSMLAGAATTAVLYAFMEEGAFLVGPVLAIPIAISEETR